MYALPYSPESSRTELMASLGVHGIPSLIVFDSNGQVITKSGRAAVDGNPDGCVKEWLEGKPGTTWVSGINWMSIFMYMAFFLVWWWYSQSKSGKAT